ncbi:MAG: LysE family translocator [Sulfurospirillum sp.]|nr:LysE family translocator [Sulfurospirillum sp.]
MLTIDTILLFIAASFMLAIAPGPDNIFVLTQSMLKGAKAGVFVTFGLCSGLIFHTSAVALGIAAIFQTSALAFSILKFIGAGYLLYLAYLSFQSSSSSSFKAKNDNLTPQKLYKRGIFMNITNPKVSIFFLAFLPQFTNPQTGNITVQIFILGTIFMLTTLIVFSSIALGAGKLGRWFEQSPKAESILNKCAGTIFAALALKLAFANR